MKNLQRNTEILTLIPQNSIKSKIFLKIFLCHIEKSKSLKNKTMHEIIIN